MDTFISDEIIYYIPPTASPIYVTPQIPSTASHPSPTLYNSLEADAIASKTTETFIGDSVSYPSPTFYDPLQGESIASISSFIGGAASYQPPKFYDSLASDAIASNETFKASPTTLPKRTSNPTMNPNYKDYGTIRTHTHPTPTVTMKKFSNREEMKKMQFNKLQDTIKLTWNGLLSVRGMRMEIPVIISYDARENQDAEFYVKEPIVYQGKNSEYIYEVSAKPRVIRWKVGESVPVLITVNNGKPIRAAVPDGRNRKFKIKVHNELMQEDEYISVQLYTLTFKLYALLFFVNNIRCLLVH